MKSRMGKEQKLFKEFPPVSAAEWQAQIVEDLKGGDPEKLNWVPYENFVVAPFYTGNDLEPLDYLTTPAPGEFPYVRGTEARDNDWKINEQISAGTVKEANRLAVESIKQGADSVTFVCEVGDGTISGVPVQSKRDMSRLLEDIPLEKTPVHFICGRGAAGIFSLFISEAQDKGIKPEMLSGSVDADPLGALALRGSFPAAERELFDELRGLLSYVSGAAPGYKALKVSGRNFHDSGASATEELAFTLASGVEYLDRLTSMDLTVDRISPHMSFSFSAGSNYFMEIAKLRAARLLWAEIVKQYKPKNESSLKMSIETVTSPRNKTVFDPYVNMLRGTVEAMAAAIGGSESVHVLPLDSTYKNPDEFSRRMARNTQLILKNESYLDRVIDPSAGSYYIENLTDSIARTSWELFLRVEKEGGIVQALRSGLVQEQIERTRNSRDMNIATRKESILGVNQYPNTEETGPGKTANKLPRKKLRRREGDVEPGRARSIEEIVSYLGGKNACLGDVIRPEPTKPEFEVAPLKPYRGAEAFEKLRLATMMNAKETGRTPEVFLLPVGNPSMRSARAVFSSNFFGCAGFRILDNPGFESTGEGVKAALKSKARIVVICSSDKEYLSAAPEICEKLKAGRPDIYIVVAGYPKEHIDELKAEGVDDFIYKGINTLDALKKYQEIAGIDAGQG